MRLWRDNISNMGNYETLPAELQENGRFCVWRYETRPGSDKPTKCPYNPRTGGGAQSTNPATFAPLPAALEALTCSQSTAAPYSGLGVGIFGDVCAIDIDHCIDADGVLSDLAADVLEIMSSYTERSPSGTGLRILFKANGFQYDKAKYYINNQKAGMEVYIAGATNKYVTVTGDVVADCSYAERGPQLQQVLKRYMLRPAKGPTPSIAGAVDIEDAPLIARAKQGRNGAAFAALWAGGTTGYNSHSEADMALCNALAWWTNRDAARVDRLFRQSGLMREKWDRPQSGSTYGKLTVENALASCMGGYDPGQYRKSAEPGDARKETASVRPPDYSDAGNAEVFVREHRGDLIFTDSLGWLWWTGKKWERDDHKATAWAITLSSRMLREAGKIHREALEQQAAAKASYAQSGEAEDGDAVKKADEAVKRAVNYLKHAQNTRNATRLRNLLELSKPALVLRADKLDADHADLNTPAGIVDLATGQLRPHEREAYCSQITAAAPGKQGEKMWSEFLDTITQGDGSVRGFLQMVAGMTLYGAVYHEGIILAYGGGRNGKATFFNALGAAVGDYTGSIMVKILTTDRTNQGASLATLRGKRLVVTGELEEHQRLSVAMLKQIASTDMLTNEEKYRQPETVPPSHSIVLFTNHLPRVGSTDGGTWRRLTVVPFTATIPEGGGVANYGDVLAREAGPAILSWAVEGAVNFARNGYKLDIPEVVEEATDAYREREDWLTNFINERCVKEPNARASASELYREYRAWAEETGDYVRRLNDFDAAMETAGFQKIKPKNKSTWVGLKIDLETKFCNVYSS